MFLIILALVENQWQNKPLPSGNPILFYLVYICFQFFFKLK